jgi:hypothetical protein
MISKLRMHPRMDLGYVLASEAKAHFSAHIRARGEETQAIKREAGYKARLRTSDFIVQRPEKALNVFGLLSTGRQD